MSGTLVLNCGSSSLKYALFRGEKVALRGAINSDRGVPVTQAAAVAEVFTTLVDRGLGLPEAVGHRLVHGGPDHLQPERVNGDLLWALGRVVPFAPLHLPAELAIIEAVRSRHGDLPQVVCFDTSFHRTLPEVARRFALPDALFVAGVHRYGFHGLSYEYLVSSLSPGQLGRTILAHLGSGASMVAVRDGKAIDTTMGFTPSAGLVMATRCGDIDPGLVLYLLDQGYDAPRLDDLFNRQSGLLALSGTSSDMRRLVDQASHDPRAELAVEIFCYQARKAIGALAAVLGGVETLVFTGGIGEHAPEVRRRICQGLEHLGVQVDQARNVQGDRVVSVDQGRCQVLVLATDEERMIARHTRRVLGQAGAAGGRGRDG